MTIGQLFHTTPSFVHHFKAIGEFKRELQSGNAQFRSKLVIFSPMGPWNLTDDLQNQYGTSSILRQASCTISKPSVNSNWSYSPETLNSGQNWQFFVPYELEIWWMALKTKGGHFVLGEMSWLLVEFIPGTIAGIGNFLTTPMGFVSPNIVTWILGESVSLLYITMTSLWARWRLKSSASRLFTQAFNQGQIKENIKALHHRPLLWECTSDRRISSTKGQ